MIGVINQLWYLGGLTLYSMVESEMVESEMALQLLQQQHLQLHFSAVSWAGGHVPDPHRSLCHASPTTLWKTATCQQDLLLMISKGSRWIEFRRVHRILCQNSADNQGCFLLTLETPRQRMPHDIAFHIHIFFIPQGKPHIWNYDGSLPIKHFFFGCQKIHNCQRFGTHGFGP